MQLTMFAVHWEYNAALSFIEANIAVFNKFVHVVQWSKYIQATLQYESTSTIGVQIENF